jgi:hypothetical protein
MFLQHFGPSIEIQTQIFGSKTPTVYQLNYRRMVVPPAGFEPATLWLEVIRAIQLRHGGMGP